MRIPTQRTFARLVADVNREIGSLVSRYALDLDLDAFAGDLSSLMEESHGTAAWYGRLLGGDVSEFNKDDELFGEEVWADERPHFDGFMDAIRSGKYLSEDGVLDSDAILGRASSYTGRMRGTANEAWVWAQEADVRFYWVMGAVEEHCEDCPDLASGGPYSAEALPTFPGANRTACLFNCKCHLRASTGGESFLPTS